MKILNNKNLIIFKLIIIIFLILIPFSISDYTDNVIPEKITSDLRFYEINTCSISLNEFLIHNPNVIYQDHYKIRFNNYSSIKCFGLITGIDQINHEFFISIGTNTIVNLFLQSVFWLLVISLIKKDHFKKLKFVEFLSLVISSFLILLLIYSEKRFYSNAFFELDLNLKFSFIHLLNYLLFLGFYSLQILNSRSNQLINFLPFAFLLIGVFSGMNVYFLFLFFTYEGIHTVLTQKNIRKNFNYLNFLVLFWAYCAVGMFYYLKPDKIRGLSHADYNFLSVFVWSYVVIFTIIGAYNYINTRINFVNFNLIKNNFLLSGFTILILGYLGSSMPYVNFMNYYYFGQTKYGTDNQNLFSIDSWGVTEAWRGFFPSAETIGEFFALGILLSFLYKKNSKFQYLLIFSAFVGLLASNNKAALIMLILCIILKLNHDKKLNLINKFLYFLPVIFIIIYFIRLENIFYSLDFSANKLIQMSSSYGLDVGKSSALIYLENLDSKNGLIRFLILSFSFISFLINRSELWGIFFARYNPSVSELFFGTGPFILSNHYGEIDIFTKRVFTGTELGFLLPHSSLLLILVFTGLTGILTFTVFLVNTLRKVRVLDYNLFLIGLFISANLIKSDSILYFPSLLIYILFYCLMKKKYKILL